MFNFDYEIPNFNQPNNENMNKVLFFLFLILLSCNKNDNISVVKKEVKDFDGNVYDTVVIGTQVWLVQDLKVTHYQNGDPIPNVTDGTNWSSLTSGAYCDYDNAPSNSTIYGKLYNWFTVRDSRNICPSGWHVPTDAEWETLINHLGGSEVAGCKLKEQGTEH